jgi:hypothetical protein
VNLLEGEEMSKEEISLPSPERFKEMMQEIFSEDGYDEEIAHGDADDLMC